MILLETSAMLFLLLSFLVDDDEWFLRAQKNRDRSSIEPFCSLEFDWMKWLVLIVLLMAAAASDGLPCVMSEGPLEASLDNFVGDDFLRKLKTLSTSKSEHDLCRVGIKLNFSYRKLSVFFTEDLTDDRLNFGEIKFDTIVRVLSDGSPSVVNTLSNICSDEDCEIDFIEKHLSSLVGTDYAALATDVSPLIINGNAKASKSFIRILANHCLSDSYESAVGKVDRITSLR